MTLQMIAPGPFEETPTEKDRDCSWFFSQMVVEYINCPYKVVPPARVGITNVSGSDGSPLGSPSPACLKDSTRNSSIKALSNEDVQVKIAESDHEIRTQLRALCRRTAACPRVRFPDLTSVHEAPLSQEIVFSSEESWGLSDSD
jgi:hypothetical protein